MGLRKKENAFLAIDDAVQLQAAVDRLSPAIIRQRLDYWTHLLGPKFSAKSASRSICRGSTPFAQIENCRNFIFKRNFPIHKIFERGCELGFWRLTASKISEIFGVRLTRHVTPASRSTIPGVIRLLEVMLHGGAIAEEVVKLLAA